MGEPPDRPVEVAVVLANQQAQIDELVRVVRGQQTELERLRRDVDRLRPSGASRGA